MHHAFFLTCLCVPFIGYINDTFYGTEGEKEQASIYRWSLGVHAKGECGYDAEIAASASDAEKQIRVLRLARDEDVTIGCDYSGLNRNISECSDIEAD